MIKDKITPELKARLIEDIKMSKETGKERGFFLCENKEEKLVPSKSCEGTECAIHLGDPRTGCPPNTKTYGEFHTHPYLYSAKQELKRGEQVSRNEELRMDEELKAVMSKNIREIHERVTRVKGVTINTPSYTDVLKALLSKYLDVTNGTVCTSTDVETDTVECWTIKDIPKDRLKDSAIVGITEFGKTKPEGSQLIRKWLDNISDRETIDLK